MLLLLRPRAFATSSIIYYGGKALPSRAVNIFFERIEEKRKKKKRILKVIERVGELQDRYEELMRKEKLTNAEINFVTKIKKKVFDEVERSQLEDERILLILEELGLL